MACVLQRKFKYLFLTILKLLQFPFELYFFDFGINLHLILEYLAFFVAFRYYSILRRKGNDAISSNNRLSIILGAALGALFGSRFVGVLENPVFNWSQLHIIQLLNTKTIMGGLFGGLLGVELVKKYIGETKSSGDLFVFPIILGIFIGRIGCFLSGIKEFTYGKETLFFMGIDLGDGIMRHPIMLYELMFLAFLFIVLKCINKYGNLKNGYLFKWFMVFYFTFRFFIEFLKPNVFFIIGLSTIQLLCVICWAYYWKTFLSCKTIKI